MTAHKKAAMSEMIRDYLKNNDISIKNGTNANYGQIPKNRLCPFVTIHISHINFFEFTQDLKQSRRYRNN